MNVFRDKNGNVLSNSISERTYVEVNGTTLAMHMVGKDRDNPVLLFLGGGPGIPEYFLEYENPTTLSEQFTVCYLNYRGTALSYSKDTDKATMTTKQYIEDAVEVTKFLMQIFGKEKIYLMGHSFGSYIGIQLASQYPQYYNAYIAMSQIADQYKSEKEAYQYMRKLYQEQDNQKMLKQFAKYPILDSEEAYQEYFGSMLRDKSMHELGVGTMRNMHSVIRDIFFKSLRCKAYTPLERINIWRGKVFAADTEVVKKSRDFNAFETVPSIEIPIYFFAGKYDYTCAYPVQKEYCDAVDAPVKKFYTFENSAHSPVFEEPERAEEIISQDILQTN